MRRPSKWLVRETRKMNAEFERKEKEKKKQLYLSKEPVYEIIFDDGKQFGIDYKGNEDISELSLVELWGGKNKFTLEEVKAINPAYLKYTKRYLG